MYPPYLPTQQTQILPSGFPQQSSPLPLIRRGYLLRCLMIQKYRRVHSEIEGDEHQDDGSYPTTTKPRDTRTPLLSSTFPLLRPSRQRISVSLLSKRYSSPSSGCCVFPCHPHFFSADSFFLPESSIITSAWVSPSENISLTLTFYSYLCAFLGKGFWVITVIVPVLSSKTNMFRTKKAKVSVTVP